MYRGDYNFSDICQTIGKNDWLLKINELILKYEGLHEPQNFYFQIFILCINLFKVSMTDSSLHSFLHTILILLFLDQLDGRTFLIDRPSLVFLWILANG